MKIREALALAYIFDLEVIEEARVFTDKLIHRHEAKEEIIYD